MKIKILSLGILVIGLVQLACELDGFLFNTEKIEKYQLPGNTIPLKLIEEVTFKSGDYALFGYWVKTSNNRRGLTVLYSHGNKHHIDEYWDRVMYLHQLGVNVFIYDYRGFGRSEGESSEKALYEDGEAALNYVLSHFTVLPDSLIIYGYSLGNVPAIYQAAGQIRPLCLISEAPFASANSLTQGSTIIDIPPRWLTEGEFDNIKYIKQINTPFLLLHGEADDFVRFRDNGKVLFENAPEPKKLLLVPKANHGDIPETMKIENYLQALNQWVEFSVKYQRK